ncbi:hypothetical protein J6590_083821 [Homalodisca vitripennis]|nr:hypothetical protein J6590_083821 [Homalodisca vitripennis]
MCAFVCVWASLIAFVASTPARSNLSITTHLQAATLTPSLGFDYIPLNSVG